MYVFMGNQYHGAVIDEGGHHTVLTGHGKIVMVHKRQNNKNFPFDPWTLDHDNLTKWGNLYVLSRILIDGSQR